MPWFIYLCHVLYNHAMFYILYTLYLLHRYLFMQHKDFHFCCIVFSHLCCMNTNLCSISTTNSCYIKICQQFHFFQRPYSETLSAYYLLLFPIVFYIKIANSELYLAGTVQFSLLINQLM